MRSLNITSCDVTSVFQHPRVCYYILDDQAYGVPNYHDLLCVNRMLSVVLSFKICGPV